ncbi:MAG: matrixin family metalloprotease [Gemmataceae bacterium]
MRPRRTLRLEGLEDRTVPALYGIPWQDPGRLTISLPPDGTAIAGHASGLEGSLDGQGLGDWRRTLLTAYQTWAAAANLNFGFRPDSGEAFGTAGLVQGDPRFGDIRIGGQAMSPEVLAVAVSPDPTLSGTWSGDVLFNTAHTFDGAPYSLLAVALHEAGHTLGLDNSADPNSVMFTTYNRTRVTLSAQDAARLRALYGVRAADGYEGRLGNNVFARSSAFRLPAGFKGETPLVAFGDITRVGDVDHFSFSFPDDGNDDQNQGEVTVRLQTAGTSLMTPKLTVMDAAGRVLGASVSSELVGDTLEVRLTGLSTAGRYTVRVEGATRDVFGVGRYGLAVRFDKTSGTPDELIGRLIAGSYDTLGADYIDAFFRSGGDVLLNAEDGANERPETATRLTPTPGYRARRYEALGSLAKQEDVDVYRLVAPARRPVLTASVWTADGSGFEPGLRVVDAAGNPVAFRRLVGGNGTTTVQLDRAVAGRAYFLEVTLAGRATQDKGNYYVSASFGTRAAPLRTFAAGGLDEADRQDASRLYVAQAQLFHLLLTAGNEDPGARVRMTLTDANGQTVRTLVAAAGESVSGGSVLLTPGEYTVRFEVENPNGSRVSYRLEGAAKSNPIGPALDDPTLLPQYATPPQPTPTPAYTYPGFDVPYDPSGYPGYVAPIGPSPYPWVIATDDPYYWLVIGS